MLSLYQIIINLFIFRFAYLRQLFILLILSISSILLLLFDAQATTIVIQDDPSDNMADIRIALEASGKQNEVPHNNSRSAYSAALPDNSKAEAQKKEDGYALIGMGLWQLPDIAQEANDLAGVNDIYSQYLGLGMNYFCDKDSDFFINAEIAMQHYMFPAIQEDANKNNLAININAGVGCKFGSLYPKLLFGFHKMLDQKEGNYLYAACLEYRFGSNYGINLSFEKQMQKTPIAKDYNVKDPIPDGDPYSLLLARMSTSSVIRVAITKHF